MEDEKSRKTLFQTGQVQYGYRSKQNQWILVTQANEMLDVKNRGFKRVE